MASNTPFTLKWGIMATGWIAESESPHGINSTSFWTAMVNDNAAS